jgi:hypothetical protein
MLWENIVIYRDTKFLAIPIPTGDPYTLNNCTTKHILPGNVEKHNRRSWLSRTWLSSDPALGPSLWSLSFFMVIVLLSLFGLYSSYASPLLSAKHVKATWLSNFSHLFNKGTAVDFFYSNNLIVREIILDLSNIGLSIEPIFQLFKPKK